MTPPRSFLAALLVVLAACQTIYSPPLDEHTLTTANGVRFRSLSGINNTCDTPYYSDPVGFGAYFVRVEQGGTIRESPKFNFVSPGQDFDNLAVGQARALIILFADEYGWACDQWQLAPEREKSIYLGYFREAITLTFEAATRFEAAGRIGPAALQAEVWPMKEKFEELRASKPKERLPTRSE